MKKKLRVQYFSEMGVLENDRLLEQDPEFYSGPKEPWKGPLRVEFTLLEQNDIDKCIEYLNKLTGNLPLSAKRGKKSKKIEESDESFRENILDNALEKGKENQDDFIDYLRENQFAFVDYSFIKDKELPNHISKIYQDKYFWMMRRIRKAKDPNNDRFDPTIIIGIKLLDKDGNEIRDPKVLIYKGKELIKENIPITEDTTFSYKKSEALKFPHYMTQEERDKFRFEHNKIKNNPEMKKSKFYKRWVEFVKIPDK